MGEPVNAARVAAAVLLAAGVLVVLVSAAGLLAGGALLDRLHYLTPVSSVGVPLVVAALAVAQGHPGRTTAKLAVIGLLLVAGGPVVSMATGRAAARRPDPAGRTDPADTADPGEPERPW